MRLPAHLRTTLLASAILAQFWIAGAVRADTGFSAAPGNALNPAPINPTTAGRWMDEEGLGTRIPAARTPTGQFYNIPVDEGEEFDSKKAGWKSSGFVEWGGIRVFGDSRSAGFLQYKDLDSGLYINNFGVTAEKPDEARFFEAIGGAVGMDDQFYRVQFGRYNDWRITAFYDGTPQVFTTTYRSLWGGLGTGDLSLLNLRPGGAASAPVTQTNIQTALAATPNSELEVIRKKAGLRLDKILSNSWKLFASFTDENRQGTRPFGAVFGGGGGGGNMELVESVDYSTYDLVVGAQYNNEVSSFNLRASASIFRNNIDTMTFQNPLYVTLNGTTGLNPNSFTQGRFDLVPNNEAYNIKGEYARAFPNFYRANLTSTVALGTMRQNDNLIAPTQFDLLGGTVTAGGAPLANMWNTPASLSRQSADARIDTFLADLGLSLKPASGLDVRGKVRYYETRNSLQYQSCNPLTGQWGRLLNDGSGLSIVTANTTPGANPVGTYANAYNAARCDLAAAQALNLAPSAGNIPIQSAPYDYKQLNSSLTADYRLGRASSVDAMVERETFRREFRERDETWEDKIKLGYVNRGAIEGTIRVSYEHANRGGSDYNPNPYLPFLSASLGPTPAANTVAMASWFHTIDQFRSFDLADRKQNTLKGRVDYAINEHLDGAVTVQLKDAFYPSDLGRTGHQKSNSLTLDLNYQAGSSAVVYGYYSYQSARMEQKGVQPNTCNIGTTYYFYSDGRVLTAATGAAPPATPAGLTLVGTQNVLASNWSDVCGMASATSPLFPDSRGWDVASKDRNDTVGIGLKYDFGRVKLDSNFTRALGRTRIGYSYNAAGLGLTPVQAALAGTGLSDLTFAQNVLSASLLTPLTKDVLVRFVVRYESGRIRDWHYDGVVANPLPANNAVYLDGGPQDYRTTVVGIMFHMRM
jgi:hypothetical protein